MGVDRIALKVKGIDVHYGDFQALWEVSLNAEEGKIASIIGANGAGKSTLLNTIAGLFSPTRGEIEAFGEMIHGLPPHEIVRKGVALVPEGRRVFPRLTVFENLVMGSYTPKARKRRDETIEKIHNLFPTLKNRSKQLASSLSGGEQQMLAIGRAMMSEPRLLLCDEISLGLAPVVIKSIYERLNQINQEGVTVILVEQDLKRSLRAGDYAYILLEGKMVLDGVPSELSDEQVRKAYFGI